jgi:diguanylate cyclase (GGDEF)-like protein
LHDLYRALLPLSFTQPTRIPAYLISGICSLPYRWPAQTDRSSRDTDLAFFDVLTGLPNRTLFYERLTQCQALARRNETLLAVLSFDLDNFKAVIDLLGHGIGDHCLQEVGRRLVACLRDTGTVGRISSDKFAIILPEIDNTEAAANVARKLIASGRDAYRIDGHELFISASIGITLFPDDADSSDALVGNADSAMYRAKDLGRNIYQFFTAEMNRNTQDKLRLEADLYYALARGEFLLYYQSKVSCTTGQVTGMEALLRWRHPQRGLVGPMATRYLPHWAPSKGWNCWPATGLTSSFPTSACRA